MQQRDIRLLIMIVIIAALAAWVAWPTNPGLHIRIGNWSLDRDIEIAQGLDLQGGMQVLLEADVPADQTVASSAMDAARGIVESRVNGLGVAEPVVQAVGGRRVLVELPGIEDPEAAVATLRQTGLMEWVDTGGQYLPPGTPIKTDIATSSEGESSVSPLAVPTLAFSEGLTATQGVTSTQLVTPTEPIYRTILTGANLRNAAVEFDPSTGAPGDRL